MKNYIIFTTVPFKPFYEEKWLSYLWISVWKGKDHEGNQEDSYFLKTEKLQYCFKFRNTWNYIDNPFNVCLLSKLYDINVFIKIYF